MGECGLFLNVQERKISEICLSHKTASFRTQFSSMEKVTQVNCTLSICLSSQISNHFNFLSFPKDLPAKKKRDSKMANWFNSSLTLDSLKIFRIKMYPGTSPVGTLTHMPNIVFIVLQTFLLSYSIPSLPTTSKHNCIQAYGVKGMMCFYFIHTRKISGKRQN